MASIFKIEKIKNYFALSPTPGRITLLAGYPNKDEGILDANLCNQIKQCGFNAIGTSLSNSVINQSLANCYDKNLVLFVNNNSLKESPVSFVNNTKEKNGFGGWILENAVSYSDISTLKNVYDQIISADIENEDTKTLCKPIFMGFSGDWYFDSSNKKIELSDFIFKFQENFEPSFWPLIFFPDLIPIDQAGYETSRVAMFYKSLQYLTYVSRLTATPFWLVCRCQGFNNYNGFKGPKPSLEVLRGIVFTALAYGAQGIVYWQYRSSTLLNQSCFDAPIDQNGDKTETWDIVQKINKEVIAFNSVFSGCEMIDCRHVKSIGGSQFIRIMKHSMGPLIGVNNASGNLLISHIFTKNKEEDDGTNYLVIVADPFATSDINCELEFSDYWNIVEHIYSGGNIAPILKGLLTYKFTAKFSPGSFRIFHWS